MTLRLLRNGAEALLAALENEHRKRCLVPKRSRTRRLRRHPTLELLVPCRDDALTMWPVNRERIGNVRNKNREVALPEALS